MTYNLELKIKNLNLEAGTRVVVINEDDAKDIGVRPLERVELYDPVKKDSFGVVVNISEDYIKKGEIGVYRDVAKLLDSKNYVKISPVKDSDALRIIRKKIDGKAPII